MIPVTLALALGLVLGTITPASGQSTGASTSTLQDAGVLRLRLGAEDQLRFQVPGASPGLYADTIPTPTTQQLSIQSGCRLASTSGLAELTASGGQSQVGFFDNSLGVREGPSGQPCGRIDSPNQLLAMKLGTTLAGKVIDFAEIDIEGKFNATLVVKGYFIEAADSCAAAGASQFVTEETYDLTEGSDSGPDSADGDNYRLRFPRLAEDEETGDPVAVMTAVNCLTLKPTAGAVSLEGGSDGTLPCLAGLPDGCIEPSLGQTIDDEFVPEPGGEPDPDFTSDSLFHLIEADGVLDCGDAFEQTNDGITTIVGRGENAEGGPLCAPIPYNQDASQDPADCDPDEEGFLQCIFFQKDIDDQQAQFFWKVVWAPEEGQYMEDPTEFDFGNGFVNLEVCGESTGDVNPPFDPDLGLPTFYPTPSTDPWCVVSTHTDLQTDGSVVVTEIFFGQFDPTGRRP